MFTESYVLYSAGFCESFVEKNYIYWLFDILWSVAVQSAVYSVHDKSVSVCLSACLSVSVTHLYITLH